MARIPARNDLTPQLMAMMRQRQGIGPFPARPETPGALPAAPNPYDDPSRRFDDLPPQIKAQERNATPASNTPEIGNLSADSFPPSLDTDGMLKQIMSLMPGMGVQGESLDMGPSEEPVDDISLPPPPPGEEWADELPPPPPGEEWAEEVDPNALNYDAPPVDANIKYATPAEKQLTNAEALQLFSQAGLRGAADLAGTVYDLPNAAFMGSQWGANKLHQISIWLANLAREEDVPQEPDFVPQGLDQAAIEIAQRLGADVQTPEQPFSLSDTIANTAYNIAGDEDVQDFLNMKPPMTREDMGDAEDLYDPTRFMIGAGLGGQALTPFAKSAARRSAETGKPLRFGENYLQPYIDNPNTTSLRDAAAGMGAGTMIEADPAGAGDTPIGQILNALAGAIGGSMAFGAGLNATRMAGSGLEKMGRAVTDRQSVGDSEMFVDPTTGKPFPRHQQMQVADVIQEAIRQATPPTARPDPNQMRNVATDLRANADEFKAMGAPMPTAGRVAGDKVGSRGIPMLESGDRSLHSGAYATQEDAMRQALSDRVSGMRPQEPADPDAIRTSIDASERAYEIAREEAAMPLLRQAQEAGVMVDAQPVLDLVDQIIRENPKNSAIQAALPKARALLFDADGNLETSVATLYEVRKEIGRLIKGQSVTKDGMRDSSGAFARDRLIRVQEGIDAQMPEEFRQYLTTYHEMSGPLAEFGPGMTADKVRNARVADEVVVGILDGNRKKRMATLADLKSLTAGDPEADLALRQSIADELINRVSSVNTGPSGDFEVSYAGLSRQFKENEAVLEWVFEKQPGAMDLLREGRKIAEALRDAARSVSAGSNTNQKGMLAAMYTDKLKLPLEAALRVKYGMLKGGGIASIINRYVSQSDNQAEALQRLMHQVMFDPYAVADLLEVQLPKTWGGASNKYLRSGQAVGIGVNAGEDEKPLANDVEK